MVVEIKGQQLRIREKSPRKFSDFATQDVGSKGRLQRLAGFNKKSGWQTQAWRFNLNDYKSSNEVINQINRLKTSPKHKAKAIKLVKQYFKKK
jgi:hypothetical protein